MRLADLFSASLDAGLYYALSGLMHTTRLTRGFDFDAEFFSKTVTAVLLTKNGSVSLLLKNGNIIGKEKNKDVNASSDNA